MKHKLTIIASLLMAFAVQAQNYDFSAIAPSGQTLYYKIIDGSSVNVVYPNYSNNDYWSGYTKPTGNLTIPSSVAYGGTSYAVTVIGFDAFYNCTGLQAVNMPTSLTSIANSAFNGCSMLTQVVVPEGVISIGDSAFYGASMVGSVTLPNTLQSIGARAFTGITGITELTIPRNLQNIGNLAFSSITALSSFNYNADSCSYNGAILNGSGYISGRTINGISSSTNINIGSHVRYIPNRAFNGTNITSITLPNSLRKIEEYAFAECTYLTTVDFGFGVERIEWRAFQNCSSLTALNLPSSLKYLGEQAFSGVTQLSSVTLPSSLETISDGTFWGCTNLTNLVFNADSCVYDATSGSSSYSSSHGVFQQCSHLTTVTIGSNVKSIPSQLLTGCPITTVTIPNSVKTIGQYAFANTLLQTVHFGSSVELIDERAFYNCGQIAFLSLPVSVKKIESLAFYGCTGLTSINIPQNMEHIGIRAFYGCSNLDTLYYNADSCFAIGDATGSNVLHGPDYTSAQWGSASAFQNLHYIYIGENVKVIPRMAFKDCKMTSVVIPNSVKHIGSAAFCRCDSLSTITFGNSVDTIEEYAFYNCSALDAMPLPASLQYIGEQAFRGMSLQSFTVPENVTFIGEGAFDCPNIQSIRLMPTEPPTLGSNYIARSFASGYNPYNSLAIHVPCNALANYQGSYRWNNYHNWHLLNGSFTIHISSADNNQGTASYVTTDCESGYVTIEGVPATHYRFTQWSDGNTDNPRSLTLTCDTLLTANFELDTFVITVAANIDSMGNVAGGGTYFRGDVANIYALANGRNHFNHWNDNSTTNPATFVVNGDTTVTAFFAVPPRDTVIQIDTLVVVDTLEIHDTTYIDIHDTTIVHDTVTINIVDTITVYDTLIAYLVHVGDTTIITYNYYDTVFVNNYYHDTVFITHYVYDSNAVAAMLTNYLDSLMSDTTYVNNHILAELYAYIDAHLPDTVIQTDTITIFETIYIHDTVVVHDTIYIPQEGVDDVGAANVKIYSSNGQIVVEGADGNNVMLYDALGRRMAVKRDEYLTLRFDVPATGTYLVKVGNAPARRIVVVK